MTVNAEELAKYLFGDEQTVGRLTEAQTEKFKQEIEAMEGRMKNVGIEPTSESVAKAVSNQTALVNEPFLNTGEGVGYGHPAVEVADEATKAFVRELYKEPEKTLSGGRVNYYLVKVEHPQREDQPPYQAECEDIIEALGLNFDEGNIFKEIWRTANERTHGVGKPGNSPVRAAEKIKHYAERILKRASLKEKK